ncbi:MAG: MmcQ/YjbR family DNA-binding protein, partial [Aggregatilineales bacterium]
MNIEDLKTHSMAQPGTEETQPFGPGALVYKVMGKMFALVATDDPARISLKCDPEEAILLRETYESVQPGYHMNKKHWNTVICDNDDIPEERIIAMI